MACCRLLHSKTCLSNDECKSSNITRWWKISFWLWDAFASGIVVLARRDYDMLVINIVDIITHIDVMHSPEDLA
jgi:hypothetical protein